MNKRLIALFVGFALIALVLILNGTVFKIDKIIVQDDSTELTEEFAGTVVRASGLETGKSVFTVSESTMIKNIQSKVPNVRVLGIERKFPNEVVIHISLRTPIIAVPFRQSNASEPSYAVVDSDMVVLEITKAPDAGLTRVEGFELVGGYNITVGEQLPVTFGDEIYYLSNIATGFMYLDRLPNEFCSFINCVGFTDIIVLTTNSGVKINLGSENLTTEEVFNRVELAYNWYVDLPEDSAELRTGYVWYNADLNKFVWSE
jgi:Cell division septal protein